MREETNYVNPIQLEDSISGLGPGLFNFPYALLALGFNVILFFFLNPETDYLIWICSNLLAAIVFHLLLLERKRRKFRHPILNYELDKLLSKAKDRLAVSRKIELWLIDDDGYVVANTTNLLFSSIILSNSVITRLLEKPVFAEPLIADEVLHIENGPRKFQFVWDFMHYSLFSTAAYVMQETLFLFILPVSALILQTGIILLALALFILPLYSRHSAPSMNIETVYGITRIEAENEIFGNVERGFFRRSMYSSRSKVDDSSEFNLGMLPAPLVVSLICSIATYITLTTALSILSESFPFIVIPLSILFGAIGFAFSFDLINPIMYETKETPSGEPSFEDEQTTSFAILLHEIPQYTEFQVRKMKTWDNRIVMILTNDLEQKNWYTSATLSDVAVKNLQHEELLVYALAELKRNNIIKTANKCLVRFFGIITLFILLYGFSTVVIFQQYTFELVLLLLFLYVGFIFASLAIMSIVNQTKFQQVDVEVQKEYPSFYTILEKLQDKGHSYEVKGHKERLEYLTKYNRTRYHLNHQSKHDR